MLGIPFDGASSFQRGTALGPPAIREALRRGSTNSWTESGVDIFAPGVLADAGDLELPAEADGTRAAIERGVVALLDRNALPLVLGGDHSITYPVIRAMSRRHPDLTILHFDAHGDLYDEYGGDRFSHACPFARIMEEQLARRLVQVGIRTLNDHQRDQVRRFGVKVHEMRDWPGPFELRFEGPVYLSIDLDVLDPAFAPGIAHPEPGGLTVRELLAMLGRLRARVVGADLVEFNPTNDPTPGTGLVCAKLVKELVAVIRSSEPGG